MKTQAKTFSCGTNWAVAQIVQFLNLSLKEVRMLLRLSVEIT